MSRKVASKSTQDEAVQLMGVGSSPFKVNPPDTTDGQVKVVVPKLFPTAQLGCDQKVAPTQTPTPNAPPQLERIHK